MKKIKQFARNVYSRIFMLIKNLDYYNRYSNNTFNIWSCKNPEQFEGSITRLYHTVEKGLSYLDYRPGFGKDNVMILICLMKQYADLYDVDQFFYRTALSVLNEYIRKNKEFGYEDKDLEKRIKVLPGDENGRGGIIKFTPPMKEFLESFNYEQLVKSRHSMRHFSKEPVDLERVRKVVELAQFTPSACNRQGWKSRIVTNKTKIDTILHNQNGNRGFGQEIDKLIVITGDLRYFNRDRELHQVFIDGGMYAMSILNALYYEGIASVPLSASLTIKQEKRVRSVLGMDKAEVFILIVGIGNYPDECQTTKSERKPVKVEII